MFNIWYGLSLLVLRACQVEWKRQRETDKRLLEAERLQSSYLLIICFRYVCDFPFDSVTKHDGRKIINNRSLFWIKRICPRPTRVNDPNRINVFQKQYRIYIYTYVHAQCAQIKSAFYYFFFYANGCSTIGRFNNRITRKRRNVSSPFYLRGANIHICMELNDFFPHPSKI